MPKDKQEPKWLTIGQAAGYVGVSRDTLRRWEKKGKIETYRSPTNRRYYTKKQLRLIMEGKVPEKTSSPGKKKKTGWLKFFLISLGTIIITAVLTLFLLRLFLFK